MDALQLHQDGGFPIQLSPFIQNNPQKSIPAVDFSEEIQRSIGDVLNKELKIYVTPTEFFKTKFREIFKNICKKVAKWIGPELLATAAKLCSVVRNNRCGISRDILFPTGYLDLSPQVRSFYLFHVYFTVRRILYEIGGIKSVDALPDDPTFNQKDNKYEIASYKKKSVVSSVSTPALTFASHMGKTTGWVMCTFRSHRVDPGLQITTIQTLTLLCSMMNE